MTILWFLLALGILVTIHEFGHFYVARRCGVKVLRFSVGFGKPLYLWRDRQGTEYTLAAIPLGGYVKMLDERDGDVSAQELPYAFTQKTPWQRIAIVAAGPIANFILAAFLYFVVAMIGGVGVAPVVGALPEQGTAARSGLKAGDEIIAVDTVKTVTWSDVYTRLTRRIGDTGVIQLDVKLADSSLIEKRTLPIVQWLHDDDQPDLLGDLGLARYIPDGDPVISSVSPDSPAESAGLLAQDRVLKADNTHITLWSDWVTYVRDRPEKDIRLLVDRQGVAQELTLTPRAIERQGKTIGQAGVMADIRWPEMMLRPIEYSFSESIVEGLKQTWQQSQFILIFIKKLIFAEVSTKNLSGTFTIAKVAGDSAAAGIVSYIAFLAFLSVSLGVFNLLPIPVLDGGHLLYYIVELIKGSPVSEQIQLVGYKIGLFFVLSVMIIAHVNDVVRILA